MHRVLYIRDTLLQRDQVHSLSHIQSLSSTKASLEWHSPCGILLKCWTWYAVMDIDMQILPQEAFAEIDQ